MKRIGRNRKNLIADVFARGVDARSFSLDGYFKPEPVSMDWVRKQFEAYDFAKLSQRDDGIYEVHVTGRQWYEFTVPDGATSMGQLG